LTFIIKYDIIYLLLTTSQIIGRLVNKVSSFQGVDMTATLILAFLASSNAGCAAYCVLTKKPASLVALSVAVALFSTLGTLKSFIDPLIK
jgi:hypothetical protein